MVFPVPDQPRQHEVDHLTNHLEPVLWEIDVRGLSAHPGLSKIPRTDFRNYVPHLTRTTTPTNPRSLDLLLSSPDSRMERRFHAASGPGTGW